MKEPVIRDALRRIEDTIAESTGQPLTRDVTILLADLRGFTAITAAYPAGVVLELLNRCFASMSEIIVRHHGTIDKFMVDSIMVIFPGTPGMPGEDVKRALVCALDMQTSMEWLNRQHKRSNMPELFMGIGINTGSVMAGVLGSDVYSAYTVIGQDVNLTSRIEAFSLRGQVLISDSSYQSCKDFAQTSEPMEVYVKGQSERVRLREVLGIPSLGKEVPRQEVRRSPRVEVRLPFSYQLLEGKIVGPGRFPGVIRDIGYHGVLAEAFDRGLAMYTEIKLDLDLPLLAYRASDMYARIVKVLDKGDRYLLGLEFTSLTAETNSKIQLFVQMLIQGNESGSFMGRI
jgi:adenylate cyclase